MGVPAQDVSTIVTDIIVEHLGCDRSRVTPEARLIEDLGADSLERMELILVIEEAFDIDIDGRARGIGRVGDLLQCIQSRVAQDPLATPQNARGNAPGTPS